MEQKTDFINRLHECDDAGNDALTELIVKVASNTEEYNFDELCELLSSAEHNFFWGCADTVCTLLLNKLDSDRDEELGNFKETIACLRPLAALILHFFTTFKFRPTALTNCIQSLHDILIPLEETVPGACELKNVISKICEHCWLENEDGSEALIPQLIPYLLLTCLEASSADVNVKRLYAIRDSLCLLDYEDASIQTIQGLLLRCFVDTKFLRVAEGRRFLSFLFTLHQDLHMLILGVMKPQLGMGNLAVAEAYGDILYRAWKDLNGGERAKVEGSDPTSVMQRSLEEGLQEVVHGAIHAAEKKYFDSLRTVLSVFHEKKNVKDVDAMLLRVYGPILWRSLRSANPIVRSQAALIFFEAFPLQNPDSMSTIELEALLQKQFDLLPTLLKDVDHRVRATAAMGVCRVLREFWEVIPSGTTHQILSYVVATLGVDGSSAAVRAAVVNGLTELLSNPLAHTVLKGLLSALSHTIHDVSERVRLCFIQLLCKVKVTRGFKFYDIVTVENLCAQLNVDAKKPAICSAMTELLLNSFYPRASPAERELNAQASTVEYGSEQIKRCLQFVQSHEPAALVFYANLYRHTSVGSAMKLCVMLWKVMINSKASTAESTESVKEEHGEAEDKAKSVSKSRGKNKKNFKKDELVSRVKRRREEEISKCTRSQEENDIHVLHFSPRTAYHTLIVMESLLKSIRSKLLEKSHILSKEMFVENFTPPLIKNALDRLRHLEVVTEEASEDHALAHVAIVALLDIVGIRIAIATSSVSVDVNEKKKKGKSKTAARSVAAGSLTDVTACDFLTCDELIKMYFNDVREDHGRSTEADLDSGFASSMLDTMLSLQQYELTKSSNSKKTMICTPLWEALKSHFSVFVDILGSSSTVDDSTDSILRGNRSPVSVRGKRKGGSSKSDIVKKSRNFQCLSSDDDAVIALVKSVQLLSSLIKGASEATSLHRDYMISTEKEYSHIVDIFAIIHQAMKDLLETPDSHTMLMKRWGDSSSTMEATLATCFRLWMTLCVHRDAWREESKDQSTPSEVPEAVRWMSSSLLPVLISGSAEDCKGLARVVDKVFAAALSPLADALIAGVAVEPILAAVEGWSAAFSSALPCCCAQRQSEDGSDDCPLEYCIPVLSRIACILSAEAILFDNSMQSNKTSALADMHRTWLTLIDIIVGHTAAHSLRSDSAGSRQGGSVEVARNAVVASIGKTSMAGLTYKDSKSAANGRKAERSRVLAIKCLEHTLRGVCLKPSITKALDATSAGKGKGQSAGANCQELIESRDIDDWVVWNADYPLARPCFDILQKKISASAVREDLYSTLCNHLIQCVKRGVNAFSPREGGPDMEPRALAAAALLKYFMCHFSSNKSCTSAADAMSSMLEFLKDESHLDKENGENGVVGAMCSPAIVALLQL